MKKLNFSEKSNFGPYKNLTYKEIIEQDYYYFTECLKYIPDFLFNKESILLTFTKNNFVPKFLYELYSFNYTKSFNFDLIQRLKKELEKLDKSILDASIKLNNKDTSTENNIRKNNLEEQIIKNLKSELYSHNLHIQLSREILQKREEFERKNLNDFIKMRTTEKIEIFQTIIESIDAIDYLDDKRSTNYLALKSLSKKLEDFKKDKIKFPQLILDLEIYNCELDKKDFELLTEYFIIINNFISNFENRKTKRRVYKSPNYLTNMDDGSTYGLAYDCEYCGGNESTGCLSDPDNCQMI